MYRLRLQVVFALLRIRKAYIAEGCSRIGASAAVELPKESLERRSIMRKPPRLCLGGFLELAV